MKDEESQTTGSRPPTETRHGSLLLKIWLLKNFLPTEMTLMLVWAGVVGMVGGLIGVGFRLANEYVQGLCYRSETFREGLLTSASRFLETEPHWVGWVWLAGVPLLGGLIAGIVLKLGERFARGRKSADLLEAVTIREGSIPFVPALMKSLSSLVSLSTGASIGREGAIAQLAAATASKFGQWRNESPQRLRLLVGCGVASGIAAAYNAPIAGALFVSEIILGNFAMEVFGPVVFASVIATLISRGVFQSEPVFGVVHFTMNSGWEIIPYLWLGVLCGVGAPIFRASLRMFKTLFEQVPMSLPLKLAAGGLILGGMAVWQPAVLGNGYEAAANVLTGNPVWGWVAAVLVMKVLATSVTVGCGAAGGIFTPTLFLGAALGSLFGWSVRAWAPFETGGPGAYALVGMGGLLAGATHAPLMAILMIFEMSLDYSIILPLMLCCVVSSFMSRRINRESIYTEPLREEGGSWRMAPEALVMTSIRVREVMQTTERAVVSYKASFSMIVDRFFQSRFDHIYVVDDEGAFRGSISLHDLKEMLHRREDMGSIIADDLLDADFPVVAADQPLAQVFEKFWSQECERLPVVADLNTRQLVGTISKRDVFGVYGREILDKDFLIARFAQAGSEESQSRYVELPEPYTIAEVEISGALDGKRIRDINLKQRFGLLALMLKSADRTGTVQSRVVDASDICRDGERLLVLGTTQDIERFKSLSPNAGHTDAGKGTS